MHVLRGDLGLVSWQVAGRVSRPSTHDHTSDDQWGFVHCRRLDYDADSDDERPCHEARSTSIPLNECGDKKEVGQDVADRQNGRCKSKQRWRQVEIVRVAWISRHDTEDAAVVALKRSA